MFSTKHLIRFSLIKYLFIQFVFKQADCSCLFNRKAMQYLRGKKSDAQ